MAPAAARWPPRGPRRGQSSREVADKERRVAAEMLNVRPPTWCSRAAPARGRHAPAGPGPRRSGAGGSAQQDPGARGSAGAPGLRILLAEFVTFAFGAHACALEVDRETGAVRILRYLALHDCGRAINPLVVEGQLQGGMAQGIGTALCEELVHDGEGQLLTGASWTTRFPPRPTCPAGDDRRVVPLHANALASRGWERAASSRHRPRSPMRWRMPSPTAARRSPGCRHAAGSERSARGPAATPAARRLVPCTAPAMRPWVRAVTRKMQKKDYRRDRVDHRQRHQEVPRRVVGRQEVPHAHRIPRCRSRRKLHP